MADGTRLITLDQAIQIQGRVTEAIGPVPFPVALKADLSSQWEINGARIADLDGRQWKHFKTSAKDGAF